MCKNVTTIDRIIRTLMGLGLIAFAYDTGHMWGYIGVVLILSAIVAYCPLYTFFGIGCEKDKKKS